MTSYTTADFVNWGKRGPKMRKRNRKLTKAQARAMVKARENKRKSPSLRA